MEGRMLTDWKEAYQEIAKALYTYMHVYGNSNLVDSQIKERSTHFYQYLYYNEMFISNNRFIGAGERGSYFGSETDLIDPIFIFGLLSVKNVSDAVRLRNINIFLEAFNSDISYEKVGENYFDNCPVVLVSGILRMRDESEKIEIWKAFFDAMQNEIDTSSMIDHFVKSHKWKDIYQKNFTKFLHWIKPFNFIPLDENVSKFIRQNGLIPGQRIIASAYFHLCLQIYNEYKQVGESVSIPLFISYINLKSKGSLISEEFIWLEVYINDLRYDSSEKELDGDEIDDETELLDGALDKISFYNPIILGVRVYEDSKKFNKCFQEKMLIPFFNEFFEVDEGYILNENTIKDSIYNIDDRKITINSIVGKNGSGKSTVSNLLMRFFYFLDYKLNNEIENDRPNHLNSGDANIEFEGFHLSVFFYDNNSLHEIELKNQELFHHLYAKEESSIFIKVKQRALKQYEIRQLNSTIGINYSLYGFAGKWNKWLMKISQHRSLQRDKVALYPERSIEGDINILQDDWFLSRILISYILNPLNFEHRVEGSFSTLNFEGKIPKEIYFKFGDRPYRTTEKNNIRFENLEVVSQMLILLGLERNNLESISLELAHFILDSSINNNLFFDSPAIIPLVEDNNQEEQVKVLRCRADFRNNFFAAIKISNQFRSTVLPLLFESKYELLQKATENHEDLHSLARSLSALMESEYVTYEEHGIGLNIIDFIPWINCELGVQFEAGEENISYRDLSSGERHFLHLTTLVSSFLSGYFFDSRKNSVSNGPLFFILDEIELYFHPEYQRKLINHLRNEVKKVQTTNEINIQFLFITHSPFILSDIPSQNILKLKDGKPVPDKNGKNSFAANIHDLLNDEFFLENGTMGEFSTIKVNELYEFLSDKKNVITQLNYDKYLSQVELIGEPVLKNPLLELLNQRLITDNNDKDQLIEFYERLIQKLKRQ